MVSGNWQINSKFSYVSSKTNLKHVLHRFPEVISEIKSPWLRLVNFSSQHPILVSFHVILSTISSGDHLSLEGSQTMFPALLRKCCYLRHTSFLSTIRPNLVQSSLTILIPSWSLVVRLLWFQFFVHMAILNMLP